MNREFEYLLLKNGESYRHNNEDYIFYGHHRDCLNDLGREGWELVMEKEDIYYFKKEKTSNFS